MTKKKTRLEMNEWLQQVMAERRERAERLRKEMEAYDPKMCYVTYAVKNGKVVDIRVDSRGINYDLAWDAPGIRVERMTCRL